MRRADGRRLPAASVVRQAEAEAQVRRVQGVGEGATAKLTRRLSGAHHTPCTRSRRKEAAPIEGLGESGVDRRGMGCDARISRIRHARHGY